MDYKKAKNVINEAINAGCKTAAELALYLKLQAKLTA